MILAIARLASLEPEVRSYGQRGADVMNSTAKLLGTSVGRSVAVGQSIHRGVDNLEETVVGLTAGRRSAGADVD